MTTATTADLNALLAPHQAPCISIYLPTARSYPESQQDPIRYRNLVDRVDGELKDRYPQFRRQDLMEQFRQLLADRTFWSHRVDGLAVLGSPDTFRVFEANRRFPERVVVGESFHVKPLLRIVQSADRYHVLCLQRGGVNLFEGNRDGLAPIRPLGIPWTIEEALGDRPERIHKIAQSEGKSAGATQPHSAPTVGGSAQASKGEDAKLDAERYFRAVDRAIWEHASRDANLPLVLVALPEDQAIFRSVAQNQHLLPRGIEKSPASLSEAELTEAAWKCVEPVYLERLQKFVDDFHTARARRLASDDLTTVAASARDGKVGVLLVEADRVIPGHIDAKGTPCFADSAGAEDDLLDDLAEAVLRKNGTVVVVPREGMPTGTGVAATNRY